MFPKAFTEKPQNKFLYSNEPLSGKKLVSQKYRIAESIILLLQNCQAKISVIFKRIFQTFTVFQNIYSTISLGTIKNVLRNNGWERAERCESLFLYLQRWFMLTNDKGI
jgi:hypothetical protein